MSDNKRFLSSILYLFIILVPNAALAQTSSTTDATSTPVVESHDNTGVEAKVRSFFADIPVMVAIAKCESGFRQYNNSGNALHGGLGGTMIGIFQIGEGIHRGKALSLGFDIDTVDGNMGYAKYLYQQSATDPWISSFPCWNPLVAGTSSTPSSGLLLTKDLTFGMVDGQVATLQQLLNLAGYTVATDGPGSRGNETTKFGLLTRAAVRKLQCDKGIACSGDEFNSGYGLVETKTRAVLLGLTQDTSQSGSSSTDDSVKIAALRSQIAVLLQLVSDLTSKLALLKSENLSRSN
jgi:hypothetical protein